MTHGLGAVYEWNNPGFLCWNISQLLDSCQGKKCGFVQKFQWFIGGILLQDTSPFIKWGELTSRLSKEKAAALADVVVARPSRRRRRCWCHNHHQEDCIWMFVACACVCMCLLFIYLLSCQVNIVHPSIPELKRHVLNYLWPHLLAWRTMAMFQMFDPWLSTPRKNRETGAEDKVEKFQLDDDFDYDNCILDLVVPSPVEQKAPSQRSCSWWFRNLVVAERWRVQSHKFILFYISLVVQDLFHQMGYGYSRICRLPGAQKLEHPKFVPGWFRNSSSP